MLLYVWPGTHVGQTCPNINKLHRLLQIRAQLQEQQIAGYTGDCGSLCVPSDQFVSFITNCEEIVSSRFMGMLHRGYV